jgi:hypothetical protein
VRGGDFSMSVYFSGAGLITLLADITNWNSYYIDKSCNLEQTSIGRLK